MKRGDFVVAKLYKGQKNPPMIGVVIEKNARGVKVKWPKTVAMHTPGQLALYIP